LATNPSHKEQWEKLAVSIKRIEENQQVRLRLKETLGMKPKVDLNLKPYVQRIRQRPPILGEQ
jgi:hypothetical protein